MENLSRYVLVTTLMFFLCGCMSQIGQLPAPIEEAKPCTDQPAQLMHSVPTVPSTSSLPLQFGKTDQDQSAQSRLYVRHYDWNGAILPIVSKMLQMEEFNDGSELLVDNVNNWTNGSLDALEGTKTLRNALKNNNRFTLVSEQQLFVAKQQLGLLPQDSLGSRSKAIAIARKVRAQYVLYSNVTGDVNAPSLQMQLILVQTGEIIGSWKGDVTQF